MLSVDTEYKMFPVLESWEEREREGFVTEFDVCPSSSAGSAKQVAWPYHGSRIGYETAISANYTEYRELKFCATCSKH